MLQNIKVLFVIQLVLVLLFPILVLVGVYLPIWSAVPALGVVSLLLVIKNLKKGPLKTSLIINNLSIILSPLFFVSLVFFVFPLNSPSILGEGSSNITFPDLISENLGVIFSILGLAFVFIIYIVTTIIIVILFLKDRNQQKNKK